MCLTKKWIKKWEDDFAKNINATNYSSEHYKKIIVSSSKMTSKLINKSHSNWRKYKKYQYKNSALSRFSNRYARTTNGITL